MGRCFSDNHRRAVGEIGEELVTAAARHELLALGHSELARAVCRVSLLSDQLGYDVTAPRIMGEKRLLEVKATTIEPTAETIPIHLSRNEADTGATLSDWSLVICVVEDVAERSGHLLGWCPASAFADLLPTDSGSGRWEQAAVELPSAGLMDGLPGAVAEVEELELHLQSEAARRAAAGSRGGRGLSVRLLTVELDPIHPATPHPLVQVDWIQPDLSSDLVMRNQQVSAICSSGLGESLSFWLADMASMSTIREWLL